MPWEDGCWGPDQIWLELFNIHQIWLVLLRMGYVPNKCNDFDSVLASLRKRDASPLCAVLRISSVPMYSDKF